MVTTFRRSREGAWIEIVGAHDPATLQYGRSREGAWIEIIQLFAYLPWPIGSLPRGSVD